MTADSALSRFCLRERARAFITSPSGRGRAARLALLILRKACHEGEGGRTSATYLLPRQHTFIPSSGTCSSEEVGGPTRATSEREGIYDS
jgi:hypothetical protein